MHRSRALGFAEGGYLLVKRAAAAAWRPEKRSSSPDRAGPRGGSARLVPCAKATVSIGADGGEVADAPSFSTAAPSQSAGRAPGASGPKGSADDDTVAEHPPRSWGLAARGATIEAGTPEFDFHLVDKIEVWSDDAARIYQQAVAAQWDPETAIPWNAPFAIADDLEDAVVQVMTYLIENETAALIIPEPVHRAAAPALPRGDAGARHSGGRRGPPHRGVHAARPAQAHRLGLSTIGGQASLKTLVDEPEFAIASFLLSVLGEGTFLSLLWFIERYAPDPVTARWPDSRRRTRRGTSRSGSRISASI